jgi:hypothetical protein
VAVATEHRQDRLGDAGGVLLGERPPLERRQLLAEEGVRVGDGLVERSWEDVVQDRPVARPGDPSIQMSTAWPQAARLGTAISAGSCSVSEATISGASRAS